MMRSMNTLHCLPRVAAAVVCATATLASAGTLQVSVTNADGKPAAHTVVTFHPAAKTQTPPTPDVSVITQKDLRFSPLVTAVPVGASVKFTNLDAYDHHVRSMPSGLFSSTPPAKQFDLRLSATKKGNDTSADIKMDLPGTVTLGCHLHGSMRGHIFVASTPWVAVTDEAGIARFASAPDGAGELRLWHPSQLREQPVQVVTVGAGTSASARLNFTPKPPPPPRDPSSY
jgi:plastocyanin